MQMGRIGRSKTAYVMAAVGLLSGCMDPSLSQTTKAPTDIGVQGVPSHVDEVTITVSGPGMSAVEKTLGEGAAVLEVPTGEGRVFEVVAGAYYTRTVETIPAGGATISLRLRNLIENGDAEQGPAPASFDPADRERPRGWTDETGEMWIRPYEGGPLENAPNRGSGENYFHGGNQSSNSVISQTIDLSRRAEQIDGGGTYYRLAGRLGGWENQDDDAELFVEFRAADDTITGTAQIGPVTPADRNDVTDLRYREQWGRVPESTRSARIVLTSRYVTGASNVDGYADELSLTLHATRP